VDDRDRPSVALLDRPAVRVSETPPSRRTRVRLVGTIAVVLAIVTAGTASILFWPHGATHERSSRTTPSTPHAFRWPGLPPDAQPFPNGAPNLREGDFLAIVPLTNMQHAHVTNTDALRTYTGLRTRHGLSAPASTTSELVTLYVRGPWIGEQATLPMTRFHRVGLYWLVWAPMPGIDVPMNPNAASPCKYLVPINATTGAPAETIDSCGVPK
jgi:hypothetical protein